MVEHEPRGTMIGVTDEGYPKVTEDYCCPHWAGTGGGLASVRECWYCKYADFRKSTAVHISSSICRCQKNRVDTKFGFTKNEI